ncbi:MAG: sulfatase-like hydrolase/transferase [Planctomycetes bacterium]|nr:sulfatase-like hydrolase/transferase [Planctomycetota bacterium]
MILKYLSPLLPLLYLLQPLLAAERPNVVLIMADDLGYECIETYGGTSYQTPHINQLASHGMRFEHVHAQPVCTPSRVKIMTGKSNATNYYKFGNLDRSQVSFGTLFKNAGYKTAIAGKWQLGSDSDSAQHFGFEQSCLWQQSLGATYNDGHDTRYSNPTLEYNGVVNKFNDGEYGPDVVSDFICDFIEENKDVPFFAYYPMLLPHTPWTPTPDSEEWDPTYQGELGKGEKVYFADMIAYMDKMVGKVVAKVEELGLAENTIIIFTGDNGTSEGITSQFRGASYQGGKAKTKDNGTHVPFISRWDGMVMPDSECFDLIDFSDVLPTICEVANASIPTDLEIEGVSFLPQLKGEIGNPKDFIYCWYSKFANYANAKQHTRNKRHKLYITGNFYDIINDPKEKSPLAIESLAADELASYELLKNALDEIKASSKLEKFKANCGGSAITSDTGMEFSPDRFYAGGDARSNKIIIEGTTGMELYSTCRRKTAFDYHVPVVNGDYDVNLYFAETKYNNVGERVFNIDVEGVQVGSNFDIYAKAGKDTELIETFSTSVTDGQLDISLASVIGPVELYGLDIHKSVPPAPEQTPFGGNAMTIPGLIEGEHYDEGGQDFAFNDDNKRSGDGAFRPEDMVDVTKKNKGSNGYNVGYLKKGEWLEYTVNVTAGIYDIDFLYFCAVSTPGALQVSLDGEVLAVIDGLTHQGNWGKQGIVTFPNVTVEGGNNKILRLEVVNGAGFNIDAVEFKETGL